MASFSMLDFAIKTARATNTPIIFIDATNNGSALRYRDAFPSIDDDGMNTLMDEEMLVLEFASVETAQESFDEIVADLKSESTLIEGEVYHLTPTTQDSYKIC